MKNRIMNKLNHPLLALIVLAGFLVLCRYSWQETQKPVVIVLPEKQVGYSAQDRAAYHRLLSKVLKEHQAVTNRRALAELLNVTPEGRVSE